MPEGFWQWLATVVLWVGGYAAGCVPFGVLVAKLQGKDLRTEGSGNIGATNAGRVLGRTSGLAVFALDVAKGAVPVLLARWLAPHAPFAWATVGLAAVSGHVWSAWLGFKGGKGVATMYGAALPMSPVAALLILVVWAIVTRWSRYVSVGSLAAIASSGYLMAFFDGGRWLVVYCAVCVCLAFYTHRENVRRLMSGTESRIGKREAE